MNKYKEYMWPGLMLLAASTSAAGSIAAIAMGANKYQDGKTNPFFYTSFVSSLMFMASHVSKLVQIYNTPLPQPAPLQQVAVQGFADRIEAERKEKVNER